MLCFYRATGLVTNYLNSKAFPIRCGEEHTNLRSRDVHFPCTYLGVPLAQSRLPKTSLVDKVANRLQAWKGRLLNKCVD